MAEHSTHNPMIKGSNTADALIELLKSLYTKKLHKTLCRSSVFWPKVIEPLLLFPWLVLWLCSISFELVSNISARAWHRRGRLILFDSNLFENFPVNILYFILKFYVFKVVIDCRGHRWKGITIGYDTEVNLQQKCLYFLNKNVFFNSVERIILYLFTNIFMKTLYLVFKCSVYLLRAGLYCSCINSGQSIEIVVCFNNYLYETMSQYRAWMVL